MDTILQSLHELEGVNGSIVADGGGRILGSRAHAVYDAGLLTQVSKQVVSAVDSIKLIQEDWDAITAQFSDGKLLIRNLSNGSHQKNRAATLAVIADARLNASFAGVAIRVAVSKLKSMLDANMPEPIPLRAISGQPSASQPNPVQLHTTVASGTSSLTGGNSSVAGYARPLISEVATSGLSWSGLSGSSSMSGSGVSVADPASSAFLTLCTKGLARSVGPMAKVFVKEAARKVSPQYAAHGFRRAQTLVA